MPAISFTGIASGIDGDAIIESLAESRRLATAPLQNTIAENEAENSAFEELNTKFLSLNDTLESFLTLGGGALAKRTATSNDQVLTASASDDAAEFSSTVNVTSLARPATLSFDDRFSSIDSPLVPGLVGTEQIDITLGSGDNTQSFSINIDSTTTLTEVAQAINEASGGSVQSTVVNAGTATSPEYLLLVQGTETGLDTGELNVSVGAGITAAGVFNSQTLEQAQDAIFSVSGVGTLTRGQNTVSDIFPGVTFELQSVGSANLTVTADADKTAERMQEVVELFNEIVTYSSENSQIERVEDGERVNNLFGPLARTRLDEQMIDGVRTALASATSGVDGSEVNIFADLGVSTERDGTLKFDSAKFKEGISKDALAVQNILSAFADKLATTDGVIAGFTRFDGLIDNAQRANDDENSRMQDSIDRVERGIQTQSEALKLQYANLEATIGGLQSSGSSLLSILGGLNNG